MTEPAPYTATMSEPVLPTPVQRPPFWRLDLTLGALTVLALLLGLRGWPDLLSGVHVLLGFVGVLWLPGYMLALTLFPGREQLSGAERSALSVGLSAGLVALFGFGLSRSGAGLQADLVLYLLTGWFLLHAAWHLILARVWPGRATFNPAPGQPHARAAGAVVYGLSVGMVLLLGLVQLIQPARQTSEFYAAGPKGTWQDYATTVQAGQEIRVPVRLFYHGSEAAPFQLQASGGPVTDLGTVSPGQIWTGTALGRAPTQLGAGVLNIDLKAPGYPEQERHLQFSLDVVPAP